MANTAETFVSKVLNYMLPKTQLTSRVHESRRSALASTEAEIETAYRADERAMQVQLQRLAAKRDADLTEARAQVASTAAELRAKLASEAVDAFVPLAQQYLRTGARSDSTPLYDTLAKFRERERVELGSDVVAPRALFHALVELHGKTAITRLCTQTTASELVGFVGLTAVGTGGTALATARSAIALEDAIRQVERDQHAAAQLPLPPELEVQRQAGRWVTIRVQDAPLLTQLDTAIRESVTAAADAEAARIRAERGNVAFTIGGGFN
jgi:hypothetical protein